MRVRVTVGVIADVGVLLGVGVTALVEVWMISWGWFEVASRLLKFMIVLLVVLTATSNVPFPVIREVTSTVVQLPEAKLPEEPINEPTAGALAYVIIPSSQA